MKSPREKSQKRINLNTIKKRIGYNNNIFNSYKEICSYYHIENECFLPPFHDKNAKPSFSENQAQIVSGLLSAWRVFPDPKVLTRDGGDIALTDFLKTNTDQYMEFADALITTAQSINNYTLRAYVVRSQDYVRLNYDVHFMPKMQRKSNAILAAPSDVDGETLNYVINFADQRMSGILEVALKLKEEDSIGDFKFKTHNHSTLEAFEASPDIETPLVTLDFVLASGVTLKSETANLV